MLNDKSVFKTLLMEMSNSGSSLSMEESGAKISGLHNGEISGSRNQSRVAPGRAERHLFEIGGLLPAAGANQKLNGV